MYIFPFTIKLKTKNAMKRLLLFTITSLVAITCVAEDKAYGLFDSSTNTLTLYFGEMTDGGLVPVTNEWKECAKSVEHVVIDATCLQMKVSSTSSWFQNMPVTEFTGIENLNTSSVVNMEYMFAGCKKLTSLDVSHFDTSKVTSMSYMFQDCSSLTSLDVSNFNIERVSTMYGMFSGCSSLISINLDGFNPKNVGYLSGLFKNCSSLREVDLSSFTSLRGRIDGMFEGCKQLRRADISSFTFNYERTPSSFGNFFKDCTRLAEVVIGPDIAWTASSFRNFQNCNKLKTVRMTGDVPAQLASGFFAELGTAQDPVFLDVPEEYRANYEAQIANGMFLGGYFTFEPDLRQGYAVMDQSVGTLTFFYGEKPEGSHVYDISNGDELPTWHSDSPELVKTVVFDQSFQNVYPTSTYSWFRDMTQLHEIRNRDYFHTQDVESMAYMFAGCTSLNYDGNMSVRFDNTESLLTTEGMFAGCTGVTTIDLGDRYFTTATVTNMRDMFAGCTDLQKIEFSVSFSTGNVTQHEGMFSGCPLTTISFYGGQPPASTKSDLFAGLGTEDNPLLLHVGRSLRHLYEALMVDGKYFGGYLALQYGYAELNEASGQLTFRYDFMPKAPDNGVFVYNADEAAETPGWLGEPLTDDLAGPYTRSDIIRTIVFDESFAQAEPVATTRWFCSLKNLTGIEGMEYINSGAVTDASYMFACNTSLTDADMRSLRTGSVTNMSHMFYGCTNLKNITLGSAFSTGKVTDNSEMFTGCTMLNSVTIDGFLGQKMKSDIFSGIGSQQTPAMLNVSDWLTDYYGNLIGSDGEYFGGYFNVSGFVPDAPEDTLALLSLDTGTRHLVSVSSGYYYKGVFTYDDFGRVVNYKLPTEEYQVKYTKNRIVITACFDELKDMMIISLANGRIVSGRTISFGSQSATKLWKVFYDAEGYRASDSIYSEQSGTLMEWGEYTWTDDNMTKTEYYRAGSNGNPGYRIVDWNATFGNTTSQPILRALLGMNFNYSDAKPDLYIFYQGSVMYPYIGTLSRYLPEKVMNTNFTYETNEEGDIAIVKTDGYTWLQLEWEGEPPTPSGIALVSTTPSCSDNAYYSMSGVRTDSPRRGGIYLHNGKKIIVRDR